jgi:hypothetical protein
MSKKSRKRNRKILGALAAGLGAMALMKGRGTTTAANVDSGRDGDSSSAKARVIANAVTGTNYPGANKRSTKYDQAGEFLKKINNKNTAESGMQFITPSTKKYSLLAGNAIPPSMRGGAKRAEGYQPIYPPTGNINQFDYRAKGGRAGHKSGGRVGCGKAKRGFGRALKKGK